MSPAKQAAIKLIDKYVERGDSIASLRASMMGHSSPGGMWADIRSDNISVTRDINGVEVNQTFKLKDIYNEIKQGARQLALF